MTARLRVLLAGASLLTGMAAHAQSSCALLNAPEMNFGSYSALGGADDAEGTILLSCVPEPLTGFAVSYTISISSGTGNPSGYYPRRLVAGAYSLDYNLFTDLARTIIWGDGTTGTGVAGGSCGGVCSVQVFGRVAAAQAAPAAEYRDQLLITIDF